MSAGLPPQDDKKYSEDDMNHIIARRIAKVQLDNLESRVSGIESNMNKGFSEIKAALDGLRDSVSASTASLSQCKDTLKKEIEKEFVNKEVFHLEMTAMDKKIDEQWKKIVLAVTVATVVIQFAFRIWGK